MDLAQRAKEIIAAVPYAALATASVDGKPWNTPVHIVHDEAYTFYWISWNGTQHSQNIQDNPHAYLVVFNSIAEKGARDGVYIQASAVELVEETEIKSAIQYLYAQKGKPEKEPSAFLGDDGFRIYKAVPETCWVVLEADMEESKTDRRKVISLA